MSTPIFDAEGQCTWRGDPFYLLWYLGPESIARADYLPYFECIRLALIERSDAVGSRPPEKLMLPITTDMVLDNAWPIAFTVQLSAILGSYDKVPCVETWDWLKVLNFLDEDALLTREKELVRMHWVFQQQRIINLLKCPTARATCLAPLSNTWEILVLPADFKFYSAVIWEQCKCCKGYGDDGSDGQIWQITRSELNPLCALTDPLRWNANTTKTCRCLKNAPAPSFPPAIDHNPEDYTGYYPHVVKAVAAADATETMPAVVAAPEYKVIKSGPFDTMDECVCQCDSSQRLFKIRHAEKDLDCIAGSANPYRINISCACRCLQEGAVPAGADPEDYEVTYDGGYYGHTCAKYGETQADVLWVKTIAGGPFTTDSGVHPPGKTAQEKCDAWPVEGCAGGCAVYKILTERLAGGCEDQTDEVLESDAYWILDSWECRCLLPGTAPEGEDVTAYAGYYPHVDIGAGFRWSTMGPYYDTCEKTAQAVCVEAPITGYAWYCIRTSSPNIPVPGRPVDGYEIENRYLCNFTKTCLYLKSAVLPDCVTNVSDQQCYSGYYDWWVWLADGTKHSYMDGSPASGHHYAIVAIYDTLEECALFKVPGVDFSVDYASTVDGWDSVNDLPRWGYVLNLHEDHASRSCSNDDGGGQTGWGGSTVELAAMLACQRPDDPSQIYSWKYTVADTDAWGNTRSGGLLPFTPNLWNYWMC